MPRFPHIPHRTDYWPVESADLPGHRVGGGLLMEVGKS